MSSEAKSHVWMKDERIGPFEFCRACGIVRRRDESKPYKPCRGPVKLRPFEQVKPLGASHD